MKRTFEEAVTVDGIEWRVEGRALLPHRSSFYDPGQDLVVEDYTIYLDAPGWPGEVDMTDVLDDEVHRRIIERTEQALAAGLAA